MQVQTMQQAVQAETGCLALIDAMDENVSRSILVILLNDVIDFLNVGKSMDAQQLAQTVDLILRDKILRNLKPEDIKVCFDNAKKGQYGKTYDRIDGQIIFEWLNTYSNERMEFVENLNLKKHFQSEEKVLTQDVNPEGQKKVIEILKTASNLVKTKDVVETLETFIPEPKKVDAKTELIQSFFNEFENLFQKNPINQAGKRYIRFNGNLIDQVEYAELKLKESNL